MRRAALVLVLASALAGCTQSGGTTTSGFKGEERNVADAIADFSTAAGKKEESKACTESLSKGLVERIAEGGKSCPSELGKAFDDADASALKIDDVTVTGTTATADVFVDDRDKEIHRTFKLVDEDGDWRIDSFG
jgi:ABC-type oligopeptide transport system substrate-binding subunit